MIAALNTGRVEAGCAADSEFQMEVSDADAEDSTMSAAGLGCSLYMPAVWKKAYGTEIVRQYQGF